MSHPRISYQNFDIVISSGRGRNYPVQVIRSPVGEVAGTFRLPFGPSERESRLKDVQIALLSATGRRRTVLSPQEQAVRDLGQKLFEALLTGQVRTCYDRSLSVAREHNQGVRLRLRVEPPELMVLPWEFLYDPRTGEYLCLSRHTPLVRSAPIVEPGLPPVQSVEIVPPLRVLVLASSPSDQQPLELKQERIRMEQAVELLHQRGLIELHWLEGGTWQDLQAVLHNEAWHIFHFIGHGGFSSERDEGFLALCDQYGETWRLNATELGRLLGDHHTLRMAVLNACNSGRAGGRDQFSSIASLLARREIPAVIAMQDEISDTAGIQFTQSFYASLASGQPIDTAVADARIAISIALGATVEWGVPVLFLQSTDGVLFEVQQPHQENNTKASDAGKQAEAYYKFGVRCNKQKQYQQAIEALSKAILLRPKRSRYYHQRGLSYHRSDSFDQAIADYTQAIKLDSRQAEYYYRRGQSYFSKDAYDDAIADLDRAISLKSDKADYYYRRALIYYRVGNYDHVIADMNCAIQLESNHADYYMIRGGCYSFKKNFDFAITDFSRSIELEPNFADYYMSRGVCYICKAELDHAIEDLSRSIKIDPKQARNYYLRATIYLDKKEYDNAILDIENAIKLDKGNGVYYFTRGLIYSRIFNHKSAIADFGCAIQLDPDQPAYYFERGLVYYYKDDYNHAIADYDQAIRLDPQQGRYYHRRGLAYQHKGDRFAAKCDFEQAVALNYTPAKESLKKVSGLWGLFGW